MISSTPENALTIPDLVRNPTLRSYLQSVRAWHGYVRFLGLPDRRDNPDVLIDRLFVEPLLTRRNVSPDENPSSWIKEAETVFDALRHGTPVVLLGDPGTGKSTLLNYLVWLLARPTGETWTERAGEWLLPVPMVLRELHLHGVTDFDGLLDAFLNHAMSKSLREGDYLAQMLQEGRALILLDGIDELGDPKSRRNLRDAVFDGFGLYPQCRWLLSSRVVGYDEVPFDGRQERLAEPSLSNGLRSDGPRQSPDPESRILFARSGLSGLAREGQEFDGGPVTRYIAPFDDVRIEAFARNWYVQRTVAEPRAVEEAAHLVRAVHADDAILRLARVPNLLTLMALIHRVEATLPHGRALLYERISEAYLESIDRFRGIYSGAYNLPQKRRWLARVGYEMQRRRSSQRDPANDTAGSELLVKSADVLDWISEEMTRSGTSEGLSAEEFLEFVGRRSGLFLPRSEGRYAFVHLSFQEYFAAVSLEREVTGFKWAKGEATPLGVTRTTVAAWAKESTWRESFSFLFELLVSKEDWHSELLDAVFGQSFSRLEAPVPDKAAVNLAQLLTGLVVNQRSGLAHEKKRSAITAVVRTALQQQVPLSYPRNAYSSFRLFDAHSIFRELLGDDSDFNARVLNVISQEGKNLRVDSLSLAQTRISDLGSLANLTTLESLDLENTLVTELGTLAHLTALQSLNLGNTQVSDLEPLAHLTALVTLFLENTQVTDLRPLARLTALESLNLENTQVTDFEPLAHLTALKFLHLWNRQVTDIEPLARLTALRSLSLMTQAKDVRPLANLTALESLLLFGTQVSDLGPLAYLTALDRLYLSAGQVTDLSPLSRLTALRRLFFWNMQVTDFTPLAHLTALETLEFGGMRDSEDVLGELQEMLPQCEIKLTF